LAILANAGSPNAVLEMGEAETAARRLGLNVVRSEVRSVDDFAPSLDALKDRAEALYVCSDPLITTNRVRLITSALGVRLPTIHGFREFVEAGGLMSYGPNFLAAVSLQLGYFLAILMRLVSTRYLRRDPE